MQASLRREVSHLVCDGRSSGKFENSTRIKTTYKFISCAYSSRRVPRQPPRGGSLGYPFHCTFNGRAHKIIKNNSSPFGKVFERWGSGKKSFFQKVFFPRDKKQKTTIPLFLWHKRRKEKAWQKESAVFYGLCPNPQAFEKA